MLKTTLVELVISEAGGILNLTRSFTGADGDDVLD